MQSHVVRLQGKLGSIRNKLGPQVNWIIPDSKLLEVVPGPWSHSRLETI